VSADPNRWSTSAAGRRIAAPAEVERLITEVAEHHEEDRGRLTNVSLEPGWTWSGRMKDVDFVALDSVAPAIRGPWYRSATTAVGCLFHGVDLNEVDIVDLHLSDCQAEDLRIHGGRLQGLQAKGVQVRGTRLRQITVERALFSGCEITALDASHVRFLGCRFEDVVVSGRIRHVEFVDCEFQDLDAADLRAEFSAISPMPTGGVALPDGPGMFFVTAEAWRKEASRLAGSLTAEGSARLQRELDLPPRPELRSVSDGELRRAGWPDRDARRLVDALADARLRGNVR
jgi:hypothetical protein